jgi:hypothetical protein
MMAGWKGCVIDVKGYFFNGQLDGKSFDLNAHQLFEKYYK